MRRLLLLSLLAVAGCSRPTPDCVHAVAQFRETLRSDPTLAKSPDRAIEMARAHRDDKSTECVLANGYADDAEEARVHPPVAATPETAAATPQQAEVPGTPRVHFEITPTPPPAPTAAAQTPRSTQPFVDPDVRSTELAPAPTVTAAPPVPEVQRTPNPLAQCRAACQNWANLQARVACEQRCEGATPLPGATAAPVIIH
jgi:hypothetical protein